MLIAERNALVLKHERLVWKQAHVLSGKAPVEDLAQEGFIGLMTAVTKFNPEMGTRFSTFAVPCIRGRMLNYINYRHGFLNSCRKEDRALKFVASTDWVLSDSGTKLIDMIPAPESTLLDESDQESLQWAISKLASRQRFILSMFFFGELSGQEIADWDDTSTTTVFSVRNRALKQLKALLESAPPEHLRQITEHPAVLLPQRVGDELIIPPVRCECNRCGVAFGANEQPRGPVLCSEHCVCGPRTRRRHRKNQKMG